MATTFSIIKKTRRSPKGVVFVDRILYTNNMKTIDKVKSIIGEHVDISNLKDDSLLENIGLDSLDIVEISAEIEEFFNVSFTSDEIVNLKTFNDIVCLIEQKTK